MFTCEFCDGVSNNTGICEGCQEQLGENLTRKIDDIMSKIQAPDGTYVFTGACPESLYDQFSGSLLCLILPDKNSGPVIQSGTAGHFRVIHDGECVAQGSIGTAGCDMNISSISIVEESEFRLPRSLNPDDAECQECGATEESMDLIPDEEGD